MRGQMRTATGACGRRHSFNAGSGVSFMTQLTAIVKRVKPETPDVKSFELVAVDGGSLPAFTPGSHIDLHIADDLVRQYSLCNGPDDRDRYLIAVKNESESRGGSRAMHERVREGTPMTISAPRNNFPLVAGARHHLLLAGGIGITPILSMARHLFAATASFELQYFSRSIEYTAFHDVLSAPEFKGK